MIVWEIVSVCNTHVRRSRAVNLIVDSEEIVDVAFAIHDISRVSDSDESARTLLALHSNLHISNIDIR
jgi:hypothetical protein